MSEPKTAKIRTRFAPSPTGHLHIGGLRTAIYAYALAKHSQGDFVLRIEDTDRAREVQGSKQEIKDTLQKFKIDWDEYYVQSERVNSGIYMAAAQKLIEDGHAFYCNCQPRNAKEEGYSTSLRDPCRDKKLTHGAIKLRIPENEEIKYFDFILNDETSWLSSDVADTTLLKSDGFPTYHLAVVVDDNAMEISHVMRAHEWRPSTPIHLLVYKYLGYSLPQIGHLTDILDPEGGKLSKRKGSVSVVGMLQDGYLPEALFNFIILLGWAPKDGKELFTIDEFVKEFDERGFQKSNPIFNRKKLDWFNGEYIRKLKIQDLGFKICEFFGDEYDEGKIMEILPLVQSRIKTLKEFETLAGFFFRRPKLTWDQINGLNKKHLKASLEAIENVKVWEKDSLDKSLLTLIDKNGFKTGDFFMDLRIAITGVRFTPPINESILILGKEETESRIREALRK